MTDTINPLDPAERWTAHSPRINPQRPAAAVGVIEVAGDDRIGSGPRLASEVYWGTGSDCDNPVEWWRPWRPEVTSARKHYKDGTNDMFSWPANADQAQLYLSRVFADDLGGVDFRLADGSEWTVTKEEVKPTPQRDLEYAQSRMEELFPDPQPVALNLGQIADSVRDMALQRILPRLDFAAELASLRARRDELLEANNRYQQEARDARADAEHWQGQTEAMARIISDTATALGAYISPSASIEFMKGLPTEARMKMELHRQNLGAYQGRERNVWEALKEFGVAEGTLTMEAGVRMLGRKAITEPASLAELRTAAIFALDALLPFHETVQGLGSSWSDSRARASVGGKQVTIGDCRIAAAAYERLTKAAGEHQAIRWTYRDEMEPNAIMTLSKEPEVLIATDNGMWRPNSQGYTDSQALAGRWTGAEAWTETDGLGPEKRTRFGIPVRL